MALIGFSNVSKMYGLDLILDHVTFQINKNERVALLGDNGSGKTTIMKLILKEIEPTLMVKEDKVGSISILKDVKIGYLDQNAIKNIENTVKEELEEVFIPFKNLENKLNDTLLKLEKDPTNEHLVNLYNEILDDETYKNNINYENKIETMISKFSFPKDILYKQIKYLSGGERTKIAFIKLLLSSFDCLLLDEPTNHLDISTIEWLETYLKSFKGTVLFISHDRYFIEELATKIIEVESHKVTTYNLNYEDYLIEKERRFNLLLEQYKKEEEEMEKLRKFIEFYKPKPRFVSRAKDREKKLEKIERNHLNEPKKVNHNIKIKLEGGNLKNKELIEVKDLLIGYDEPLIKDPISFSLYGKDRLAIIGDNGIGKTTLVKTILKEIAPKSGEIIEKRELTYGYIKQNDHSFKKGDTILDHLRNEYPSKLDSELRTALGSFLFKKDDVFKDVSNLSNGEKVRLNLCSLVLSSYDILILDEPTNHLDLVTKECLINGLKNYNGAIIFISHDRYFINQVADFILELKEDKVTFFEGAYDEFKHSNETKEEVEEIKIPLKEVVKKEEVKKENKLSKNNIAELEKRMEEIEVRIKEIDEILSTSNIDYKEIEEYNNELEDLEEEYLEIINTLE